MFYTSEDGPKGLAHNPFKAIVAPRPIAWISTRNADGSANLAPYSYFNAFNDAPPMIAYGTQARKTGLDEGKDSLANIRRTGEFAVNIVSYELRNAMNVSSQHFPAGEDEFAAAGLSKAPAKGIDAEIVAEAPAALECKLWKILDLPGDQSFMVIATVTGVHIQDRFIREGRLDVAAYQPLARLGYRDYARVSDVFELTRPDD